MLLRERVQNESTTIGLNLYRSLIPTPPKVVSCLISLTSRHSISLVSLTRHFKYGLMLGTSNSLLSIHYCLPPKAPTPLSKRIMKQGQKSNSEKSNWFTGRKGKVSKHHFHKIDIQHFAAVNNHQHSTKPLGGFLEETSFISNCIFVIDVVLCSGIDNTMGD